MYIHYQVSDVEGTFGLYQIVSDGSWDFEKIAFVAQRQEVVRKTL